MVHVPNSNFADRQKASAEAKKALLQKFKPKPMVTDPNFEQRQAEKAAELERVRRERAEAKEAARRAAAEAAAQAAAKVEENAQMALDLKRAERRDRKAAVKAAAKARREERKAQR